MRRFPGWSLLLVAVGFAALASYVALGWLNRQAAVPPPKAKPTMVVRAINQVGPDLLLSHGQLQEVPWDKDTLPQDFFVNVSQVAEKRVTKMDLKPGDLITRENTTEKRAGIAAELSPTQRAMTVKVDEASGVAGFLVHGDRVDVVVVVDKGAFDKDPLSKVLMQNLKVLATGQKMENRPGDKPQVVPTVTLAVTPEEGEALALAAKEGYVSLVLRGQNDQALVHTPGIEANRLFGRPTNPAPEAPVAAPVAAPSRMVEVIRGVEKETVNF